MADCRICDAPLRPFISFGKMPIANGFLTADEFHDEYFYELETAFCGGCGMVQIVEQPKPQQMFHGSYPFYSGNSKRMAKHFEALAKECLDLCRGAADPLIVELGSNDGTLLRHVGRAGVRHLGIEPSANVAEAGRRAGVDTLCAFFDEDSARRIVGDRGQADCIVAANVMCHIANFHSVAVGVHNLLRSDGLMVFEDPYLGDVIEKTSYDQIYDEHVFIFSVMSVANAFERHGLELVDAKPLSTHGGSMRYFVAHKGRHPKSPSIATHIKRERRLGLDSAQTHERFRAACERSRDQLLLALQDLRAKGQRVVGYGATSKSTTVTNFCGITPDLVEFISDTTPDKQGKYSPGVHIPVRPYEDFACARPDYALLFAWNHEAEIRDRESAFMAGGGKWIRYVPEVHVGA